MGEVDNKYYIVKPAMIQHVLIFIGIWSSCILSSPLKQEVINQVRNEIKEVAANEDLHMSVDELFDALQDYDNDYADDDDNLDDASIMVDPVDNRRLTEEDLEDDDDDVMPDISIELP